jgi:hypothetical protein
MSNNKIISGTAMAVLLGFGSIVVSMLVPNLGLGDKIILFVLGCSFTWLGMWFSRG